MWGAIRIAAADGIFSGGLFSVVFSNRVSLVGSRIDLLQFLRIFLLLSC